MKAESKFFTCSCYSEGLLITSYPEDNPIEFELGIFKNYTDNPSWWSRIKYAFWHLRTGRKHLDSMILDEDTTTDLIKYLVTKLEKHHGPQIHKK